MSNPVRALASQFLRCRPTTLLAFGIALSFVDLVAVYLSAAKDGVLHINQGVGLYNHYGFFATIFGNAIALYAARKYYDGVCSIKTSKAVVKTGVIEKPLNDLRARIELRKNYRFFIYVLLVGSISWVSNFSINMFGNPKANWGLVFDLRGHPWSFLVGRVHLFYSWILIIPFGVYVMFCSSTHLHKAMVIASKEKALKYDLLNPDQRGGFGFVDNALLAFNVVAALAYIEITLHIETFARFNLQHLIDYIILTALFIGINKLFFADMYATIRTLKLESLNKVKDKVFTNDKLSFEILKYCYERRLRTSSIANFVIQVTAIAVPGIIKFWPFIVKAFT